MADDGPLLVVRPPILHYGNLPFAATLPHLDSTSSLQGVLRRLLEKGTRYNTTSTSTYVELQLLGGLLDIPESFAKVLADTIAAVAPSDQEVRQGDAVDVHAVALFLFAQLYARASQRPDTKDIWPTAGSPGGGNGGGNGGNGGGSSSAPSHSS